MAISAISSFSQLWIRDTGTSRHFTYDQSLFLNFWQIVNQRSVQGLGQAVIYQGIGDIKLEWKDPTKAITSLLLRSVHSILDSRVSFISQSQLQKKRYALKIVSAGIKIRPKLIDDKFDWK